MDLRSRVSASDKQFVVIFTTGRDISSIDVNVVRLTVRNAAGAVTGRTGNSAQKFFIMLYGRQRRRTNV
uniref:Uncharacterized protein n=1 Tax=Romanomermis culicivorax TaxID=13658 RepID=A0A915I023_ROMCU